MLITERPFPPPKPDHRRGADREVGTDSELRLSSGATPEEQVATRQCLQPQRGVTIQPREERGLPRPANPWVGGRQTSPSPERAAQCGGPRLSVPPLQGWLFLRIAHPGLRCSPTRISPWAILSRPFGADAVHHNQSSGRRTTLVQRRATPLPAVLSETSIQSPATELGRALL